jgi:hypothetical protein
MNLKIEAHERLIPAEHVFLLPLLDNMSGQNFLSIYSAGTTDNLVACFPTDVLRGDELRSEFVRMQLELE